MGRPAGAAPAVSVQDFADWNAPQAHASAIAATGVPLLSAAGTLISALLQSVAAAGGTLTKTATFTQTGWALNIITNFPAAATVPFVEVTMTWEDPVTAAIYGEDHYFIPGSSGASGFTVLANGVVKSGVLNVTVTNLDPAQIATVSLLVSQDSVTRAADRWAWRNSADNGLTIPANTLATLPDDESSLGILNGVTIPASSNATWLFGMAPGKLITLSGFMTVVTPANVNFQVRSVPSSVFGGNAYLAFLLPASNDFTFTFTAGRAPMSLKVTNTGTVAGALNVMMTAAA